MRKAKAYKSKRDYFSMEIEPANLKPQAYQGLYFDRPIISKFIPAFIQIYEKITKESIGNYVWFDSLDDFNRNREKVESFKDNSHRFYALHIPHLVFLEKRESTNPTNYCWYRDGGKTIRSRLIEEQEVMLFDQTKPAMQFKAVRGTAPAAWRLLSGFNNRMRAGLLLTENSWLTLKGLETLDGVSVCFWYDGVTPNIFTIDKDKTTNNHESPTPKVPNGLELCLH